MSETIAGDAKMLIESVCRDLESAQGTQIAKDYQNALNLIAQVVFTRTSGFILEFIQNAEDAGQGLASAGHFSIFLNRKRLRIVHDARPFNAADVRAVCGIRSSKNPERGTLGYLGIGFKSFFKVTTAPHIFSGDYRFKFDKSQWPHPNNSLWRVLPIWIEEAPEPIEADKTTFFIPLKDNSTYDQLAKDVRKLGTELYLFLRWLRQIDIHDEESGERWSLENVGDADGVTALRRGGKVQRFRLFRKTVDVPDFVREDELTEQYRVGVRRREIAVAFALDAENNLAPSEAGAMYGGVYSFLPLGETSSGAKFPIQADFLVQPGRDAINCEAKWNHWLVSEVERLCEEAIEQFKSDPIWKFQFLPVFSTDRSATETTPFTRRQFGRSHVSAQLTHSTQCYTISSGAVPDAILVRVGANIQNQGVRALCRQGRHPRCRALPGGIRGGTRTDCCRSRRRRGQAADCACGPGKVGRFSDADCIPGGYICLLRSWFRQK